MPTAASAPLTEPNQGHPSPRAQRHLELLDELVELGMDLARSAHATAKQQLEAAVPEPTDATATPPARPAPDPTIPFDRIVRGVRRSMLLARRLEEPLPADAATPADAIAHHRIAARKRIIRDVEDAIQRTCTPDRAEHLHAELLERLDSPDLDDEIDHRPPAEIIADICRDFGIAHIAGTHPWKRRTPADIAELRARAAAPAPLRDHAAPAPAEPIPDPSPIRLLHPTRFRGK